MRYRRLLITVLTGVATVAATLSAAPAAHASPPEDEGWFQLVNQQTVKCLAVQGATNHAEAFQTDCSYYDDQYFRFEWMAYVGGVTYYRIRKFNTSLCLYANGTDSGARIRQYSCGTYLDQQWSLIYRGVDERGWGYFQQVKNRNSGRCVVGQAPSRAIFQAGCASMTQNWPDQFWTIWYFT